MTLDLGLGFPVPLEWLIETGKFIFVFAVIMTVTPVMAIVERRGAALIQNRLGPNRVGPQGLLQPIADAIKFLWKEDSAPGHVKKFYYNLAPLILFVFALITFAVIPFAAPLKVGSTTIHFQLANLNMGIVFIFSIASLGIYGIMMAGWASQNKYSSFGALRSASQMISYEITLGLSVLGLVLWCSSLDPSEIIRRQGEVFFYLGSLAVPKWGVLVQPLGFILFLTAAYAETNRLPFDLPEAEPELVAGYHLEYGGMRFAIFFMGEYINMFAFSALATTLFFGGWQLFPGMSEGLAYMNLPDTWQEPVFTGLTMTCFFIKVAFLMWLYVWVRWTLPRFRYDQLMNFGWKVMLPLALINLVVMAGLVMGKVI